MRWLAVTSLENLVETLLVRQQAFYNLGLHAAWERVAAVVVSRASSWR
jgi:tagatose-1,6-bisphosphate aldolase non-catalytic subunit AgaZ/GatZ